MEKRRQRRKIKEGNKKERGRHRVKTEERKIQEKKKGRNGGMAKEGTQNSRRNKIQDLMEFYPAWNVPY